MTQIESVSMWNSIVLSHSVSNRFHENLRIKYLKYHHYPQVYSVPFAMSITECFIFVLFFGLVDALCTCA